MTSNEAAMCIRCSQKYCGCHVWDQQYHAIFGTLIIIGGGLCIGGIWEPPLLVPGGVCLTGALAMFASAYTRMYPWHLDDHTEAARDALHRDIDAAMGIRDRPHTPESDIETPTHITRPQRPSIEQDIQININVQNLNLFEIHKKRSNSLPAALQETTIPAKITRSKSEPILFKLNLI